MSALIVTKLGKMIVEGPSPSRLAVTKLSKFIVVDVDRSEVPVAHVRKKVRVRGTFIYPAPPVVDTIGIANTSLPTITGPAVVGSTLTGHLGDWTGPVVTFIPHWTRDGATISDATAYTYLQVSGDATHAIRFAPEAVGDAGSVTATSAPVTTAAAAGPSDIADQTALLAMLNAGVGTSGGKTYTLAAGSFGDAYLSNYDFSSNPIVLQGQAGTTFGYLVLDNCKGLTVNDAVSNGSYQGGAGVRVLNGSSHITLNRVHSLSGAAEGTQTGNGYQVRDSTFVTVNGAEIAGRGNAVSSINADDCTFEALTIHNNGVDGILISGSRRNKVNKCLGYNFHSVVGDHPDWVQWFSSAGIVCDDLVVTNNLWLRESGDASQGYFGEYGARVLVQGNALHGGMLNAVSQSSGSLLTINDNFLQGFADYGSRTIVRDAVAGAIVTNNDAGAFSDYAGGGANTNYFASGNTLIGTTTAGNYTALDAWLATHPLARARP